MATLTIRNVDAAVKERLRLRAARHGRSMEAEARTILSEAVAGDRDQPEPNLAEAIRRRFAPLGGVDLELPREFVSRAAIVRSVIVVDTNVISELMRGEPHPAVLSWVAAQPRSLLYASYVSQAEILYGIAALPEGRRRTALAAAAEAMFAEDFAGRALTVRGAGGGPVSRDRPGPPPGREADREIRCADRCDRTGGWRQHCHARYWWLYGLRSYRDRSMDGTMSRKTLCLK